LRTTTFKPRARRFLPIIESELQISGTWPSALKDYIENLKYFNRFKHLVTIRNRLPSLELKLREAMRKNFEQKFARATVGNVIEVLKKRTFKQIAPREAAETD
jgi:hypothetical protein